VVSKPPAARRKPKASTEAPTKKLSNAYPDPKVLHFLFLSSLVQVPDAPTSRTNHKRVCLPIYFVPHYFLNSFNRSVTFSLPSVVQTACKGGGGLSVKGRDLISHLFLTMVLHEPTVDLPLELHREVILRVGGNFSLRDLIASIGS
jgi:hypothetical protein